MSLFTLGACILRRTCNGGDLPGARGNQDVVSVAAVDVLMRWTEPLPDPLSANVSTLVQLVPFHAGQAHSCPVPSILHCA